MGSFIESLQIQLAFSSLTPVKEVMTNSLTTTEQLQPVTYGEVASQGHLLPALGHILCCVGDEEIALQVKAVLAQFTDLTVVYCTTIEAAIAQLTVSTSAIDPDAEQPFDCVLISASILQEQVKLSQQLKIPVKIPAIALLKHDKDPDLDDCLALGIADYLTHGQLSVATLKRCFFHVGKALQAQQQTENLRHTLQKVEEQYRLTLDASKDGIWDWTITQQELDSNDRFWEMLGLRATDRKLTFEQFKERIHPEDYQPTKRAFKRHLYENEDFSVEVRLRNKRGEYRDFWIRGQLQRSSLQGDPRMCGLMTDITERKRNERRSRFLSQASSLLNASLDCQATLENLAWLAVPRIADWCILAVDLEGKTAGDRLIVSSHCNPAKEDLVEEFAQTVAEIKTPLERPVFATQLSPIQKKALRETYGWSLALIEKLALQSYIWIPLQVGKRSLGFLFFAWAESYRSCSSEDMSLLQELAYRTTWSLENMRLYDERQAVYQDLQAAIAQLRTQQKRLETLQHLTTLINHRLTNIPELLQGIVQQICKDVPAAQDCVIALHDLDHDDNFFIVASSDQPRGMAFAELLRKDEQLLANVYQTGEPYLRDFQLQHPLPCSLAAVAIESVSSGRLGVLVIGNWQLAQAFDQEDCEFLCAVGEETAIAIDNARLIKTLEQQNQELLETSRVKDLFLATVSHELRTPMNAILGFSQVLLKQRRSNLGHHEQQILQRILSNGRSLMALINDILDVSQMKLTELKLLPSTFNVEELASNIVAELQSLADEKKLLLTFDSQLADPYLIHDQKRIRQVVVNLLANALTFTHQGTVSITLTESTPESTPATKATTIDDDRPPSLSLIVEDTGIGIAEEHLAHIFSEFWQAKQNINLAKSGTGLGLAITYKLVQRMQGTIEVNSKVGQGTQFIVTLPRSFNTSLHHKTTATLAPVDSVAIADISE